MALLGSISYWVGQANDTLGTVVAHGTWTRSTPGWVSGQRWQATATQWASEATDWGGAAYSKAGNQMWQTTASQWKADRDAWIANYNDMVAQKDYWVGQYNAMLANRDYWQHTVAHNDANVWTNQYNAGYGAGNTAGYNAGVAAAYASIAPETYLQTNISGTMGAPFQTRGPWSVTFNRNGHWAWGVNFYIDQGVMHTGGPGRGFTIQIRGVQSFDYVQRPSTDVESNGLNWSYGHMGHGAVSAGQVFQFSFDHWLMEGNCSGWVWGHFSPTSAQPA